VGRAAVEGFDLSFVLCLNRGDAFILGGPRVGDEAVDEELLGVVKLVFVSLLMGDRTALLERAYVGRVG
jgi:hypothetical protein